jgi:hypothetical protein
MKGRLSDQTIMQILTDPRPQKIVAADHGVSFQMIGFIKRGVNYANVHPEIPRCTTQTLTRRDCVHWLHDACDLEFPDPKEVGLRFATWCAAFHDGSG